MSDVLELQDASAEALMGEIVDELLGRTDRGERPEVEEYVRRYPQLAAVLRQMLPSRGLLRWSAADGSSPESPPGDYRLVREVGRGGMGVYAWSDGFSGMSRYGGNGGKRSVHTARLTRDGLFFIDTCDRLTDITNGEVVSAGDF